ncbi:MAG: tRNA uridine-5-carboxymethylaminomethyl(34) synthesis GTPase MnmE [Bacteroidales bacterium]|nr:tRNA uridine-5-carboxymethylaminomethyl(34) synthesis GTPase MnmE [Bacteroidales bacterium]
MPYYDNDDTIYAPATIPGTGAISVIRVSGPKAIEIADRVVVCQSRGGAVSQGMDIGSEPEVCEKKNGIADTKGCAKTAGIAEAKGYTIKFGSVYLESGELLDEVLVSVFRAPHSYTGENSVEISCHASSYIVGELSGLLSKAGARPAEAGEFTKRAFLNGKMDLAQAEAVADVIAAQSAAAHRIAMSQLKGGFSSELKSMREELLRIVSLMELELDFSEEDVEFADRTELDSLLEKVIAHVRRLAESFRLGNAIKNGVPTAIVGATNVGKSTLMNALLGEDRAIVSDIHGTTRDTIEETLNIGGILFRLIDTAGLRDTSEIVERIGIERTRRKISEAEIVLGLVDGTLPISEISSQIQTIISQLSGFCRQPADETSFIPAPDISAQTNSVTSLPNPTNHIVYILVNKCDILSGNKDVNDINRHVSLAENMVINIRYISAKTGEGLDALKSELIASQKDKIANSETSLVTNQRHLDALRSAEAALQRVREGLRSGIPADLLAQDTREAIDAVGSISGIVTSEDMLSFIFSNFCIGK